MRAPRIAYEPAVAAAVGLWLLCAGAAAQQVTLPGQWCDQDKTNTDSVGWGYNYYDDADGNGVYTPGEAWSDTLAADLNDNQVMDGTENWGSWLVAGDMSCWAASASNMLCYVGGADRYMDWVYNVGCGGKTWENSGSVTWALQDNEGYALVELEANQPEQFVWYDDPIGYVVGSLGDGLPVGIAINKAAGGIGHALTVYAIDTDSNTIIVTDSNRDRYGTDEDEYDYWWDSGVLKIDGFGEKDRIVAARSFATNDWQGAGTGGDTSTFGPTIAWSDASNWSGGVAPDAANPDTFPRIEFTNGGLVEITSAAVAMRVILKGSQLHLDVTGAGSLEAASLYMSDGLLDVAGSVFANRVDQVGGAANVDGGQLVVAGDLLAGGIVYVRNSGTVQAAGECVVDGSLHLDTGGSASIDGALIVGRDAAGLLDMDEVTVQAGALSVGEGSAGSVVASNSMLAVSGTACIGDGNTGSVMVFGGTIRAYDLELGRAEGSRGSLYLFPHGDDPPQVLVGRDDFLRTTIYVGYEGQGLVAHSMGFVGPASPAVLEPNMILACMKDSEGTYTLGSGRLVVKDLTVGRAGDATFTQSGGQVIVVGTMMLAAESGGSGNYYLNDGQLVVQEIAESPNAANQGYLNIDGGLLNLTGPAAKLQGLIVASAAGSTGGCQLVNKDVRVYWLRVGDSGTGTLEQVGGSMIATETTVGRDSGATGIYILDGGTLSTNTLVLGSSGEGRMRQMAGSSVDANYVYVGYDSYSIQNSYKQEGGDFTIGEFLAVASGSGSLGRYELIDGNLAAPETRVGWAGEGSFVQSGGSHVVGGDLLLSTSGTGTYELAGGRLEANQVIVGDGGGNASFVQTGGSHRGAGDLYVGSGSYGTYVLSGAASRLSAADQYIGHGAAGEVTQTDGINRVHRDLYLGCEPNGLGTYRLDGGVLAVDGNAYVGHNGGVGRLEMGGGTVSGPTGTLTVSPGSGRVVGHGTLDIRAHNAGLVDANGGVLALKGPYSGAGQLVISPNSTFVFQGGGVVGGPVNNGGTLTVRTGTLRIDAPVVGSPASSISVDSSGTLRIDANAAAGSADAWAGCRIEQLSGRTALAGSLDLTGEYLLAAGAELSDDVAIVAGQFAQPAGLHDSNEVYIGGTFGPASYVIAAGTLTVARLHIGYHPIDGNAPGALNITDANAQISVSEDWTVYPLGALNAAPGAEIHMTGSTFENRSTDPGAMAGLENLTLIFEGGPSVVDTFEVAGQDVGASPAGFARNFALDALVLGGSSAVGRIRLVDALDNQPGADGAEALYVKQIVFTPGSGLDTGGIAAYYLNGESPKRLFGGDADLDGDVDFVDYITCKGNFGTASGASWAMGDTDADGDVDFVDYITTKGNFGSATGGSAAFVPEPAALSLLAACALLPLGGKRRRQ